MSLASQDRSLKRELFE